jgi:DNA-binding CsgD family transcriptional regulator
MGGTSGSVRRIASPVTKGGGQCVCTLLRVRRPTDEHRRNGRGLQPLTPAETKVLANLFAGRTLIETATTLDITRTAKTHLEHIFLKTG